MHASLPSHLPARRSPGNHILPSRCPSLRLKAQCSLICLALCAWLAGCGSSHTSASHSSGTTTAPASTPPSAPRAGLEPYLIQGNEETGYAVQRPTEHYKTAAGYAASEQDPEDAQRLSRAGFQQALVENTGGGNGLSYVLQFATVSDATREQSFEFQTDSASQGGLPFRFSVSGVPATDGFGARPVEGQGDANALFREGRCLLLVGDMSAPHPKSYEAAVVAGVQAIYARTVAHHGACSG
jgi:hypothetical protein